MVVMLGYGVPTNFWVRKLLYFSGIEFQPILGRGFSCSRCPKYGGADFRLIFCRIFLAPKPVGKQNPKITTVSSPQNLLKFYTRKLQEFPNPEICRKTVPQYYNHTLTPELVELLYPKITGFSQPRNL